MEPCLRPSVPLSRYYDKAGPLALHAMCQGVDGVMGTTLHLGHPSPALGIVPRSVSHTPPPPRPPWSPILVGGTVVWSRQALVGTGPAERLRIPRVYCTPQAMVPLPRRGPRRRARTPYPPRTGEYPVRGGGEARQRRRAVAGTLAPASRPCSPHRSACRLVYKY